MASEDILKDLGEFLASREKAAVLKELKSLQKYAEGMSLRDLIRYLNKRIDDVQFEGI
jgi:hypothetical protein